MLDVHSVQNNNLSQNMAATSSVILPIDCKAEQKSNYSPLVVTYMRKNLLKGKVHVNVINICQKGVRMHKGTQTHQ